MYSVRFGGLFAAGSILAPLCPECSSGPADYGFDCWYTFLLDGFVWREASFNWSQLRQMGLCYERVGRGLIVGAFGAESVRWAMIYGVWSTTDAALMGLRLLVGGKYVVETIKHLSEMPPSPRRRDHLGVFVPAVTNSTATSWSKASQLWLCQISMEGTVVGP